MPRFKLNHGKPMEVRPSPAEIIRFLSKVKVDARGCWIWTAFKDEKGYGKFKWRGISYWAHRFSRQALRGAFPPGHEGDHKDNCRNPGCVNPDHIAGRDKSEHSKDSGWKRQNLNKPARKRSPRPVPDIPDDGIPI